MKKIIGILLTVILLISASVSLFGCKDKNGGTNGNGGIGDDVNYGKETFDTIDGLYVLYKGDSEYSILLPADAEESSVLAANEFNEFFSEATEVALPIVYDNNYDATKSYISIGDTVLFRQSGIVADDDELGSSGYIVKTYNNDIILKGSNNKITYGNIYAVYTLLEQLVGYHYVAEDAYSLNKKVRNIQLPNMDYKRIPAIPVYTNSLGQLVGDDVESRRLFMERFLSDKRWATNYTGHSQIEIMRPENYPASYFYHGPTGYALNYSNTDMIADFAELLKGIIREMPEKNGRILQVGQPDTQDFCNCAECRKLMEKKCMNKCGLQIWFMNRVLEILDPWLEENYPDADLLFTIFAYQYSETPPVKWSEEEQKYVPFSEYVIPHKRLGAYFAPIGLDYSIPMDEGSNKGTYENLRGLADLFGYEKITVWNYCTNFRYYCINMNNFGGMAKNFKIFADAGVEYVFDQGPATETFTFSQLRAYLQANLAWDPSQDMDLLAKRFCDIYYGDGGEYVYEYYKLLTNWYAVLESRYGNSIDGSIYFNLAQTSFWPLTFLGEAQSLFDKAYAALEPLKSKDPSLYRQYWERIRRDNLQIDYLKVRLYSGFISQEFIDEFNYYRVYFKCTATSEGFED